MTHFPKYLKRAVQSLDGLWDIAFLGNEIDPDAVDCTRIHWTGKMTIPGVVDTCPDFVRQRGCFALRRTVDTQQPNRRGWLEVGGLGLWARVIVDGVALGTCQTPYAPWGTNIPASQSQRRELIILLDNRIDANRVPLFDPFFDFYGYAGIYRSLAWHELEDYAIDRVAVTPLDLSGNVRLDIRLSGKPPSHIAPTIHFDEAQPQAHRQLRVENGVASLELKVPDPRPWSPDAPHLHTVAVDIGHDAITERFGIRTVSALNGAILLNGNPVKLLGYNRHEAHPQFGPALPPQQLLQDLQLLRSLGCNFVRGSHYPQDQRFLDLCDELGFLVWEEGLGWGAPASHFSKQIFVSLQEQQVRAMVRTSINHPCVILWGFLNECDSHKPESDATIARLADTIRQEDGSRLVTFASNHPFEDRNFDKVDVISVNQYPGWYAVDRNKERPLDEIEPLIDRLLAHLIATGQNHKPFIISEIGAGAIYGWRDELEAHWSEQYQAAYLGIVAQRCVTDPQIAGLALWQFCDCRTYADSHALGRPRAFNNKGTFDEYRRPKLAAQTVRSIFSA